MPMFTYNGSGSADRVTEDLKINLNVRGEYEHDTKENSSGTSNSYVSEDYSASDPAVPSRAAMLISTAPIQNVFAKSEVALARTGVLRQTCRGKFAAGLWS